MGLVKFEVEIPNFEKELSINITIRRDGEVFFSTSSPSMENINKDAHSDNNSGFNSKDSIPSFNVGEDIKQVDEPKKKKKSEKLETKTVQEELPVKKRGNFMNAEF